MTALDFPDSPSIGQGFDRWVWNGTAWTLTGGAGGGGLVAYSETVAFHGGFTATPADINNLGVTFNAIAGHTYKTTLHVYLSGDAGAVGTALIADGTGAQVQSCLVFLPSAGVPFKSHNEYRFVAASSGPVTLRGRANLVSGTGTITVQANPTFPAFIMVEDVTPSAGGPGGPIGPAVFVGAVGVASASFAPAGGVFTVLHPLGVIPSAILITTTIDGRAGSNLVAYQVFDMSATQFRVQIVLTSTGAIVTNTNQRIAFFFAVHP